MLVVFVIVAYVIFFAVLNGKFISNLTLTDFASHRRAHFAFEVPGVLISVYHKDVKLIGWQSY